MFVLGATIMDPVWVPVSSGNLVHATIRDRLVQWLRNYFDQNGGGRVSGGVDCRLRDSLVRRPGLAIFRAGRLDGVDWRKIPLPFAPDIAVEVLSPSESAIDVHRKALEYLAAGSSEVWQLDYENGEVFVQTDGGVRLLRGAAVLDSSLLPGFTAEVGGLFAGF